MSALLFYACDAREDQSGKVFFRFRDFSELIFVSKNLENAYQNIADTLNALVKEKIAEGKVLPKPSPRMQHEFAVEVLAGGPKHRGIRSYSENTSETGGDES